MRSISSLEAESVLGFEEGHFLDLKAREIAPGKLSQTISAFANTAGGEVFIGIEEDRTDAKITTWRGFVDQEAANPIFQMLEELGGPDIADSAFLESNQYSGYVLHLVVRKMRQIVRATNGTAYVRRGAQKLPVSGEEAERRLALDKGLATFEDETVKAPLEFIDNSVTVLEFVISQVPTG